MGSIALDKIEDIEYQTKVLKAALEHFDYRENKEEIKIVSEVVPYAYTDRLLFREFELWFDKELDANALMFQIRHFLKTKDKKPLPERRRNLTGNKRAIEKIKRSADQEAARKFARKLRILSTKKGLTTNKKLGDFLEISAERARVLLAGKHKPHRETLLTVAKAFGVPVEQFFGG